MGLVESYVSSYRCVGSLSYKPNNGRDVGFQGLGVGGLQRSVGSMAGVGGWSASRKGMGGNQENQGLESLFTTVLLPTLPPSMCVLKNTQRGKKGFV